MLTEKSRSVIFQCQQIHGFQDLLSEIRRQPPRRWRKDASMEEWAYDTGRFDENLHIIKLLGLIDG